MLFSFFKIQFLKYEPGSDKLLFWFCCTLFVFCCILFCFFLMVIAFMGPLNYPKNAVSMCKAWKQDAHISISLANIGFFGE